MSLEIDVTNFKSISFKATEASLDLLEEFVGDIDSENIVKVSFVGVIQTTTGLKAIDGIYTANQINPDSDGSLEYTSTSFDCSDVSLTNDCFDVIREHGIGSLTTWVDAKSGINSASIEKNSSTYLKLNRMDCNNVD